MNNNKRKKEEMLEAIMKNYISEETISDIKEGEIAFIDSNGDLEEREGTDTLYVSEIFLYRRHENADSESVKIAKQEMLEKNKHTSYSAIETEYELLKIRFSIDMENKIKEFFKDVDTFQEFFGNDHFVKTGFTKWEVNKNSIHYMDHTDCLEYKINRKHIEPWQ